MIELTEVSRWFGSTPAVEDLSLKVPQGVTYGLLGPNGSGKTTTLRVIMGILAPDRGQVRLLGTRPSPAVRGRVGYLPEERGLYRKMEVMEQLIFLARLRGLTREEARERAYGWLSRLGLESRARSPLEELSKGMQQKVQFIGTVLHDPELLILDEPFSGLDPLNQELLEELVLDLRARGVTIVLSTHRMELAQRLCQHVCLLSQGRVVLDGPLSRLRRAAGPPVVELRFQGSNRWLEDGAISEAEETEDGMRLRLREGEDPNKLLARALQEGVEFSRFEVVEPGLRQLFLQHAGGTPGRPPVSLPAGAVDDGGRAG